MMRFSLEPTPKLICCVLKQSQSELYTYYVYLNRKQRRKRREENSIIDNSSKNLIPLLASSLLFHLFSSSFSLILSFSFSLFFRRGKRREIVDRDKQLAMKSCSSFSLFHLDGDIFFSSNKGRIISTKAEQFQRTRIR